MSVATIQVVVSVGRFVHSSVSPNCVTASCNSVFCLIIIYFLTIVSSIWNLIPPAMAGLVEFFHSRRILTLEYPNIYLRDSLVVVFELAVDLLGPRSRSLLVR